MNNLLDPLVSIIVPTFNHDKFISRAIQSVINQTYINWEMIIIDNYSTDDTEKIVLNHSDPRISYFKFHNYGVIAASRNRGISIAKGEWTAFLDSDDWWFEQKLNICFQEAGVDFDFIYHDLEVKGDKKTIMFNKRLSGRKLKNPICEDLLVRGNCIPNSSVVVRTDFLKKVLGFNQSVEMVGAEDLNTWLKISQFTENFLYIPEILGGYLSHDHGISKKDMSLPHQHAVQDYLPILSPQKLQHTLGLVAYIKAKNEVRLKNWLNAMLSLQQVLLKGRPALKLKALYLMLLSIFMILIQLLSCDFKLTR